MAEVIFKEKLGLCFKGQRDYVYASDVLDETLDRLMKHFSVNQIKNIDFTTHNMSHQQLRVELYSSDPEPDESMKLKFSCEIDEQKFWGHVFETDENILGRTVYDEDEITDLCSLDFEKKQITFIGNSSYRLVDTFTAMNKFMLHKFFPEITGKWLSVRTRLNVYPVNDFSELKVVFKGKFGDKYTQSELYLADEKIGILNFALI